MSATAPPDFAAIKKASRTAGLVTLAGSLVVLASISYSVWRLADTESKLNDEKKQVEELDSKVATLTKTKGDLETRVVKLRGDEQDLRDQINRIAAKKKALEDDIASIAAKILPPRKDPPKEKPPPIEQIKDAVDEKLELEKQLVVLRKEAGFIRKELKLKFADPQKNLELWSKPESRGVMTIVLVSPDSSYLVRNDPSSPTGKWYDFTLKLKFPNDPNLAAAMKRDIKSVTYELNHPYRKILPLVSDKAGKDFSVKYDGAGTLRNVVVKIDIAGVVGFVVLDYDMTKAHPEAKKK